MKLENTTVLDIENEEDFDKISLVCDALRDKKRLKILKLLQSPPYKYSTRELSNKFQMPVSTLVHHLDVLEKAHLISTRYRNDSKKESKFIQRRSGNFYFTVYKAIKKVYSTQMTDAQTMPIGSYADFEGDTLTYIINNREHRNLFSPERFQAQLLFTPRGIIEYHFGNSIAKTKKITGVSFSLEICSEFPFYDNSHQSDITFWLNGVELTTYRCDGDYGDRRGNLNPYWWPSINTQYGKIVNVSVNEQGTFLNGILYSDRVTLKRLKLSDGNKISLKFGNKNTAEFPGGFNLFGKEFGDYPQDIIFQLHYQEEETYV